MSELPAELLLPSGAASLPKEDLVVSACLKNAKRLVAVLAIAYVVNYLDRNSIPRLDRPHHEQGAGPDGEVIGWGCGPDDLQADAARWRCRAISFMQKVGARLWLSRIMITWGIAVSDLCRGVGS